MTSVLLAVASVWGLSATVALGPNTFSPRQDATISGDVVDSSNLPLAGVVVTVRGMPQLAVTDDRGRFTLAIGAGPATMVFSLPGFTRREIPVGGGAPVSRLHITLTIAPHTEQVTVRAPVVGTPPDDRFILRPLDVVRTAGTQADVMRALMALPGVEQVDDGAGLFVRGGDVSETRVLLDGTVINHPYRYETPTGGFRGAVDPFLTQGVTFTTGGFSSEYGDTLSGVVDLHGLTRPMAAHQSFTAGLAGVAGQVAQPIGAEGGLRLAVNKATPSVLFAVNPSGEPFDRLPGGWDFSGGAYLDTRSHGSFHVFALDQADHVGVQLQQDAFVGFLHSNTTHAVVSATYQRALGPTWDLRAAAGTDRYDNGTNVGVLEVHQTDQEQSARADLGGRAGAWTIRLGGDAGATRTIVTGTVPSTGSDFAGVAGSRATDVGHRDWTAGVYAELTRALGRVATTFGVREEYFAAAATSRTDPRLNITVDFGAAGRLRLAWGLYHQAASPAYFDAVDGALTLPPMAATHYILGYEVGTFEGAAYLRAEGYAKSYRDLPVQDSGRGFVGTGYGWARGLDLFGRRVWHFIDVRASASWLATRRRWTSPTEDNRFPLPSGASIPDFDIPYAVQVVANVPLARSVALATSWRVAAGKPFTPVVGATLTPAGYEPTWAPINSDRVPAYERLDLAVSHTRTLGAKVSAVFFLSVDNVLNRENFFSYAYSADYSTRRPVPSAAPRSVYIGCSITH
jgi:vitamin B12 transporter